MLLRTQGRLKAAEALYEKVASLWQDVRYAPSLVQYGDLISQTRLAHSHAKTMYQRALGVNPLKTLEVAALPGHRCWLCSNATRDEVKLHPTPCKPIEASTSSSIPFDSAHPLRGKPQNLVLEAVFICMCCHDEGRCRCHSF